jgi:hypothetical protein
MLMEINNKQTIADTITNHFISIAENINVNNKHSNINSHTI